MINGPMVGGFLIACVLVAATLFAGTWFHSAVQFSDAHSLDAARTVRPVVCSFNINDDGNGKKTTGYVHSRDGYIHFDIHDVSSSGINDWGVEIDMNDPGRMATQANPADPFVSLDDYPDLRVQVLENLRQIMLSDQLHCAPWWSSSGFRFSFEGHL